MVEAKQNSIRVLPALVKRMMDRNMFLFGSVDINDAAMTERINEITKLQNVGVQIASERCFANSIHLCYLICIYFILFSTDLFKVTFFI